MTDHPTVICGLRHDELAKQLAGMRYDALANLLRSLSNHLMHDAGDDLERGRRKLSKNVDYAATQVDTAAVFIQQAWDICEEHRVKHERREPRATITDPIVFLDFDGVLNNNNWIYSHSSEGFDHIAPELVERVNWLLGRTGAKVVVSSAWRALFNQEELQTGLNEHGFTGEIIGCTDRIGSVRGHQIRRWRDDNNHTGPFVILDDSEDMAELMPWLVRTDPEVGITNANVEAAVLRLPEIPL